jgi:carbamoyltransferase
MYILGISAFYHDSAACLLKEGEIIAAAQEERFTRIKHDERFPQNAVEFCLKEASIKNSDLSYVAFYENPQLKLDRLVKTYLMYAPSGFSSFVTAFSSGLRKKFWLEHIIRNKLNFKKTILYSQHHQSHAASAFFPSPFQKAAFLTMDGVGEWTTTSFGKGSDNTIQITNEIHFPHSLGLLYSAFTYYTGFKVNSGEYKVMGLAPYGKPRYRNLIYEKIVDVKEDGSFKLNMDYFNYTIGFTMTNDSFHQLFNRQPRKPESPLTQLDMDLAASIQEVTEEIVLKIGRYVYKQTGEKNLAMAGGVALNCVANSKLLAQGPFENIWIQPAAGDAGGALGAALYAWNHVLGNKRNAAKTDSLKGSYLGSHYSDEEIETYLKSKRIPFTKLSKIQLVQKIAELILKQQVVGWFQGRMEYGPRALGARSILADARSPKMQSLVNLKIKFREGFRPFAPSVLYNKASEWFEYIRGENKESLHSPYMLLITYVKKNKRKKNSISKNLSGLELLKINRSQIPAVTHLDYSARIQTVHPETNRLYYDMIHAIYKKTKCPVVLNTSFNIRGEPIVESIEDAYLCFMRTHIDYLAIGSYLLDKKRQPVLKEIKDWQREFQLD